MTKEILLGSTTLANFWQKNEVVKKNVEIDRIMEKFSKDVLCLIIKRY